ncbi:MAG TPA: glycerol-3-phosphate dehydrogenase/oxidase [Saprospiraceae bacterium]|nr:glycerol-3-phosphate dehydrogenase/oxidase [Saprospiraceae bacterium]
MIREEQLKQMINYKEEWDLLVIGGGASGLGTALDAVSRGWKVLLVEKYDFGKGTSSRSTKLVHGGVRYLAQGNIALVREALKERAYLLEKASHNVRLQPFIIPFYSLWMGITYYIGLKIYDLLSGKQRIGKTTWLKKSTVQNKIPSLISERLQGGILYYDGQFDDARLCIDLVKTIINHGGTCINYCSFKTFIKNKEGTITGAVLNDTVNKTSFRIRARFVINATGVFTNKVVRKDEPDRSKMIVPSRGSHVVVDKTFLNSDYAIMIPKTSDGRVLFIIPWLSKVVIGTTDVLTKKVVIEPKAEDSEIEFILENTGSYLVNRPGKKDIQATFAGLRPLAAPNKDTGTKEISRGHQIVRSPSGLYTLIGGKWTTFRRMGQDAIDKIIKDNRIPSAASSSLNIPILAPEIPIPHNPDQDIIEYFLLHEMAVNAEDVLARRMRIAFLDQKKYKQLYPHVESMISDILQKSSSFGE